MAQLFKSISLIFVLVSLGCLSGRPADASISRWFSASYLDLRFTLRRFSGCMGDLLPVKDYAMDEQVFLVHKMKVFLDEANYDQDQLQNVTKLMNEVCRTDNDSTYPISKHVNVTFFEGPNGKENRCNAIDQSFDSMYAMLRRAAANHSEPLDFDSIVFPAHPTLGPNGTIVREANSTFPLIDLINTSWIKSDVMLEQVCNITSQVKDHVRKTVQSRQSPGAQDRSSSVQQPASSQQSMARQFLSSIMSFIDRLLEPILGLQKRFYWESTNSYELMSSRVSNTFSTIRSGIGKQYKNTRDRISDLFFGQATANQKAAPHVRPLNGTNSAPLSNSTNNQIDIIRRNEPKLPRSGASNITVV